MTDQIDQDVIEADDEPMARPNRRRMLLAGAGLAGVAALTKAGTASAADGADVLVGGDWSGNTATRFTNTQTDPEAENLQALVGTIGDEANPGNAILGTTPGTGAGLAGVSAGGYGGEFEGGVAPIRLVPPAPAPDADVVEAAPEGDAHLAGELYVDSAGDLWFNKADGSNWTKLNDQAPSGAVTFLPTPQRAYDSREEWPVPANTNKGRHAALETREIDLTEFTDLPAGAAGALINLTVDATGPAGWAFVFSGDVEVTGQQGLPLASSINWAEPGQIVANTTFTSVSADSKVKVHTSQPTEIIIDVIGYVS